MKRFSILCLAILLALPLISTAQTITGSFSFDGLTRDYRVYIPGSYTGNAPVPLVFNLHGRGSNAFQQELYADMNPVADTAGFIICYPDGIDNTWNAGFDATYTGGVDDVGFINALLDTLNLQYNIDPAQVYSCGMSMGGFMSFRLACDLENRIAAIASVTGSMTFMQADSCVPSRPIPTLQIHGTTDLVVAYEGNQLLLPVDSVFNYWRGVNTCSGNPVLDTLPDLVQEGLLASSRSTVTTQHYPNCQDGVEVLLYKVENGGHTWPSAPIPIPLNNTNEDIHGSVEVWSFFKRFTHPNPFIVSRTSSQEANQFLRVGPNPYTDRIHLQGIQKGTSLELINAQGQMVWKGQASTHGNMSIELPAGSKGLLWLRARMDGSYRSFKLLPQAR